MAAKKPAVPFKLGDRVKIRLSNLRGPIVELRGPLGPGGIEIYRVRHRGSHGLPTSRCARINSS